MLYTGKANNTPEGFQPQVNNDLGEVKASGAAKFGFWFCVIITFGIFYLAFRVNKMNWLNKMQISINTSASDIDNQLIKRYDTLTKLVDTVKGHTQFNKEVYENIAAFRNGMDPYAAKDGIKDLSIISQKQDLINKISSGISMQFEQYPTLGADVSISKLMQESIMIEKEISATRRTYNAKVKQFNQDIYTWPTCVLLDKKGYHALPLIIASETQRTDVKVSF